MRDIPGELSERQLFDRFVLQFGRGDIDADDFWYLVHAYQLDPDMLWEV